MRIFWDKRQLAHAPAQELHNGKFQPHAEHPGRAENMIAAVGITEIPVDHGEEPLLRVHGRAYLDFLRQAWNDWRDSGRPGDAGGYAWPIVRRRPLDLDRIDARLGLYSFDASTPIAQGTWLSSYWAAQSGLSALDSVLAGERYACAICRPPGHHAGADYLGGYCYINNAAVAAAAGAVAGRRVAILDVDYHHGNGSQDIFYARGDVMFVSIHADPRTDYPFYWGYSDELGEGEGEGVNLNLPLPRGSGMKAYLPALDRALEAIAGFGADLLICSFGADTYCGDPISFFTVETNDYPQIAERIASLGVPVLIVTEGGYAVDALGGNVAAFLSGF
jgi:acetoin utilization deacetylase AcuC-like enzyme